MLSTTQLAAWDVNNKVVNSSVTTAECKIEGPQRMILARLKRNNGGIAARQSAEK
jgi:hypothetical protein